MSLLRQHATPLAGAKRGSPAARPVAFRGSRARVASVRADAAAVAAKAEAGLEKAGMAMKPVLDIEAIKGVLPHRCVGVFLFLRVCLLQRLRWRNALI